MAIPDSMLLTIPPSTKRELDFNTPHDYSAHQNIVASLSSKSRPISSPPEQQSSYLPRKSPAEGSGSSVVGPGGSQMSGSTTHRNLPPPLSLPDPRGLQPSQPAPPQSVPQPQSVIQHSSLGPLPSQPQWQGNDEQMSKWLQARSEEERTKQEEERTKQEHYRLEQRRIEQNMLQESRSMLQESLRAGVPPIWIPMLFIAIAGGAGVAGGGENLQNYLSQLLPQMLQGLPGSSPEVSRSILHPQQQQPQFGAQSAQSNPQTPLGQGPFPQFPAGPSSTAPLRSNHPGPSGTPGRGFEMLPRLATAQSGSSGPAPTSQPQEASPIFFHHWTPPTSQSGPSGAGAGSGNNPNPSATSEYSSSPKKRKLTASHPSNPPPPARFPASDTGGRRTGHSRQRSDMSMRGMITAESSTRPSSSAADTTPIHEGQPSQSTQRDQHSQWHQKQQTPQPTSRDAVKPEDQQPPDSGGTGSKRSSERASEDIEMAER